MAAAFATCSRRAGEACCRSCAPSATGALRTSRARVRKWTRCPAPVTSLFMPRHDQRHDARQKLDADLHIVDIESGVEFHAEAIDTCGGGLSFHAAMEPALGAEMEVTVPGRSLSVFKVLRISAAAS